MLATCLVSFALISPLVNAASPLSWLGADAPWYPGPDVSGVPQTVPDGCAVDQVIIAARHGSHYPDQELYKDWAAFAKKMKRGTFSGPLAFLSDWTPADSASQLGQLSDTGVRESRELGNQTRYRYPNLRKKSSPFFIWADSADRAVESARFFARGFGGENATNLGTLLVVDAKGTKSGGDSLATSELCPRYVDTQGANQTAIWNNFYLPGIVQRLERYAQGVNFTTGDVLLMSSLCAFETQILDKPSPFCGIRMLAESEFQRRYEYSQDLRYYYGTGPESGLPATLMLPYLEATAILLSNGPGYKYPTGFTPPPIVVSFTHDHQINELATALGVFNTPGPLLPDKIKSNRRYVVSRIFPMAGRIAFERMTCSTTPKPTVHVRVRVNDAVYPLIECQNGPGKMCPLEDFENIVKKKLDDAGSFLKRHVWA
ncbi:PHOsphatase [Ceratobasidium sp. UAMH 11750]|nr:PHOsphatase [Ceratobasidium sp. UAMH 11750]